MRAKNQILNLTKQLIKFKTTFDNYAELKRCIKFEHWGTNQSSCEFRSIYKLIPLSSPVSIDRAKATFKRGILRVEINKRKKIDYKIPIT